MSNMKQVLVCYHSKCVDGLFAARNAYLALNSDEFKVTYSPINYGTDETLDYHGDLNTFDAIMFVDWCPDMPLLRTLLENEDRQIIVLDHHERAKNNLQSFPVEQYSNLAVVITDNLSGAGLVGALGDGINLWPFWVKLAEEETLQYVETGDGISLYTNVDIAGHLDPTALDEITRAVQGRDLWLDGTIEKTKGLYLDAFLKHHRLVQISPTKLDAALDGYGTHRGIINQGKMIFETVNSLCQHMLDNALKGSVNVNGTVVDVIVGMCIQGYASTFGELGYKDQPNPTIVIGIQPYTAEGKVELSFRCNGGVNVDNIAHDLYNGGGHIKASGARMNTDTYCPSEILNCVLRYIANNPSSVLVTE